MSQLTLVIGNKNYSSWSLRPWILMRTLGLAFTEKRIALFTATTERELAPYFSDGKVPVLLDGDFRVWDSLAILEYVSEQHLDGAAWPRDRRARAAARAMSAEMHAGFAALRSALPMNCRKHFPGYPVAPEAQRDIERIKHIWRYAKHEYGARGDWLFGEYSIADAMFAPVVLRLTGYDVPLEGMELDYARTVLAQEAMREWVEAGKRETEIIAEDEVDSKHRFLPT